VDPILAWSEEDGAGGRTIRARVRWEYPTWDWHEIAGDVRADPAASAEAPSLSANEPASGSFANVFLAFLETAPGGVPQVRAAEALTRASIPTWTPLAATLNRDPSVPAADPSTWARGTTVVAWVEGGQVLARVAEFDSGPAFGDPVVLNADPARPARSPRATIGPPVPILEFPTVVFLESGPAGDEIRARKWDGAQWMLVSVPANAGLPGPVTWLAASPGPVVAWVDQDGLVRVRVANF
jgi:hypothetical protein